MKLYPYIQDFIDLVFPPHCLACEQKLFRPERHICLACKAELPRTDFEKFHDNPVFRRFIGRFPLRFAGAWLHFQKAGKVQKLMHAFKYRDQEKLAVYLGRQLAKEWRDSPLLASPDVIIPVPLHPRKQRKRGYNQAQAIAEGLSAELKKPLVLGQLNRIRYRNSQTKEKRFNRWQQVHSVFQLKEPASLAGLHILLVDDVITTGATLEACLQSLAQAPDSRFSVLTLAHA
ncbi:ComF family protein [Croceimicrobium hydrocarbonivorans]|uniref:ComF family protein n=1 Tax=Croceimicrobium hydrocarbonivorans TaxID=2761580 RepID=A0A7H0VIL9_9FLAO|nr:ComF family protein [Croceimicrobium hydrocarbonivorans]QNR25567.1 ComF family protein [Croceimicrobium hydrocarbonivorans]